MKIRSDKVITNIKDKNKLQQKQHINNKFEDILTKAKDEMARVDKNIKNIQKVEVKKTKDLLKAIDLAKKSCTNISSADKNILKAYNSIKKS